MSSLAVRNAHSALFETLSYTAHCGYPQKTGDEERLRLPGYLVANIDQPRERVVFHELADPNPLRTFSDAVQSLRAASAEVQGAIFSLRARPDDATHVKHAGKVAVLLNECGELSMSPFTSVRGDLVAQFTGASLVFSSFVQEVTAYAVGLPVGRLHQGCFDCGIPLSVLEKVGAIAEQPLSDPYALGLVTPEEMLWNADFETFFQDLEMLLVEKVYIGLRQRWLRRTAVPMLKAWQHWHKAADRGEKRFYETLEIIEQVESCDWRHASIQWLARRAGVMQGA